MTRKRKSSKNMKIQRKGRYGRLKSRQSLRQVFVKVPGGKTVVHYKKKKPGKAHCSECGALLPGIPRELPTKMKNIPKTAKRPERPYGGVLCSKCTRKKIIEEFRR